jgi:hypothetical protein
VRDRRRVAPDKGSVGEEKGQRTGSDSTPSLGREEPVAEDLLGDRFLFPAGPATRWCRTSGLICRSSPGRRSGRWCRARDRLGQ